MKKFWIIMVVFGFALQAVAQQAAQEANGPVITFEKKTHDFGDIVQGDKVQETFKFTNTGTEPLLITNVEVTCGCTVPNWQRDPIMPGARSEIVVVFNSTGKMGRQNKVVKVVSNAVNPEGAQISFTTNVLEKKATQ
ncbi:MAG TPA: DUF1573 domain-containing protein [Ohtaekwangia sp.]|nr:DUF1573 domain-containing protein [Ohtaekwangia sp.]